MRCVALIAAQTVELAELFEHVVVQQCAGCRTLKPLACKTRLDAWPQLGVAGEHARDEHASGC